MDNVILNNVKNNTQESSDIPNRIKHVRKNILGLSLDKLAEIANINVSSIKNWERGKIDFLTTVSINNVLNVFDAAGIYVSEKWLRTGSGDEPCSYENLKDNIKFNFEEEDLFKKIQKKFKNETSIVTVLDNSMSPMANCGDRVGGVIYKNNFQNYIGLDCIIKYDKEKIIVRRFQEELSRSTFLLVPYDQSDSISTDQIVWIAPVCRRWIY